MEKDKSRGLKHRREKTKYKGNSTKNPKYVPVKVRPQLESNWDRYERPEDEELGPKLTSSTNFALLAGAPLTIGSRLQTNSAEAEPELFALNVALLAKSLATVPFWQKLGISKEYFEESQIREMEQRAQANLEAYEEDLEGFHTSAVDLEGLGLEDSDEEQISYKAGNKQLGFNPAASDLKAPEQASNSHDLEKWLDDILGQ